MGIAVDQAANAYVTGETNSDNFPTTPTAFQTTHGGLGDAFILKVGDYVIAGRVIDSGGNPVGDAAVTMSGTNSAVQADGRRAGRFAFLDTTEGGEYTVTASKDGFDLQPAQRVHLP